MKKVTICVNKLSRNLITSEIIAPLFLVDALFETGLAIGGYDSVLPTLIDQEELDQFRATVKALHAEILEKSGAVLLAYSSPAKARAATRLTAETICYANDVPDGTDVDVYLGDNKKSYTLVNGKLVEWAKPSASKVSILRQLLRNWIK